jgi:hypothetical protein
MTDVFGETVRTWQNFYFMAGGASAGLLGLMFVTLSMGTHLITDETQNQIRLFVTPSIVYFVSALLVACVMLVPAFTPPALALILVLGGLGGTARIAHPVWHLIQTARKHQDFDLGDWLAQIIFPPLSYILILAAGVCLASTQWSLAFFGVWAATILLLICAIANTWSLVMWIVEQRKD